MLMLMMSLLMAMLMAMMSMSMLIVVVHDVNDIYMDVHVDGNCALVEVHDYAHVVYVIAHNGGCHSWADPESFWFLAHLRVVSCYVHVDVDINVHADIHVVHVNAHHDYYDWWVDHANLRFLSQLIAEIWYFIIVDVHVDVHVYVKDVYLDVILMHMLSMLMLIMMAMMDELVLKISGSYHNG